MEEVNISQFRSTLRKIERFLFKNLKVDGGCCDISFNECHILMEVTEAGQITMSELIDILGLDKSVVTRTVDKMVRTGLLDRREMSDDRRRKIISLSEGGMAFSNQVNSYMNGKFTELFSTLESDECCRVVESAESIAGTFNKWDEKGD